MYQPIAYFLPETTVVRAKELAQRLNLEVVWGMLHGQHRLALARYVEVRRGL